MHVCEVRGWYIYEGNNSLQLLLTLTLALIYFDLKYDISVVQLFFIVL